MTSNVPAMEVSEPAPVGASTPSALGAAVGDGFPGPLVTGIAMILGPLLALVATAVGASAYHAKGADFVEGMVAHPAGFGWGVQLALASMMLLLVAVIGLATMITARRPGWGRTAGVLTVIGLCGPVSFESIYWAASKVVDTGTHRAVAAVLIDRSQVIPHSIMNISGPCLVVGFVLLGIAAAKSGVLDRSGAVLLGLTCLIPVGFISGYLTISAVAFVCTCLALVPLGVRVLRAR